MNSPVTFTEVSSRSARRVASRARRAARLPALLGVKRDAHAVLDELVVLIAGLGAVGATAALSLAHLQVGELRLVDRGRFKPASLLTQPISASEVGQPKASAIGRLCKDLSPRTRVLAFDGPLQELALADIAGVNTLVVAGDNFTLLHDAGQHCLRLGLKLIHAAVHGETLTAQCRAFGHSTAAGPCPVCLFNAEEFRMMNEERVLSCEGFRKPGRAGFGRSLHHTASLQPLCGMAGSMAALQAVKMALELGPPVQDTLLEVCAYTWRSHVTPVRRNPECPCAHERYSMLPAPRALGDCTLAELNRAADLAPKQGPASLIAVEGFRWIERGLCGCAESRPVNRLLRAVRLHSGPLPQLPPAALSAAILFARCHPGFAHRPVPKPHAAVARSRGLPRCHRAPRRTGRAVDEPNAKGPRMNTAHETKPMLSLSALHEVALSALYRAIFERVAPGAAGPEPWRRRKLGAAHELLALAQVSGRIEIQFLELSGAFRTVFRLRVPVPCRRGGVGPLVIEPVAQLGFTYRPESMTTAQNGYSFFEILTPRDVHHPNIAPSHAPPGAQVLCLGPSLPAGIKVVDLVLLAYAAISLQSVQFSLTNPAGLLNPAAAIFLQTSNTPTPLTREPFVMPRDMTP